MPHLLRQLGQVLVVPSVWPEPLSLTMLEGMAAGLPVIASRTGGTPEAIQDNQNGLLFDTGDINQLTKAIDTLDGDRPLAHKLGCRAWETIRNQHSMEKMIMGLLEPSSASVKTGSASGKQENTDAYRVQSFAYSW